MTHYNVSRSHKTFYNGHKPDIGPMKEKWNDILKQHNEHPDRLRLIPPRCVRA